MDSFGREGDDIMGVLKIQDESVDRGRVVDFYVHFMYIKIAIRDGINVRIVRKSGTKSRIVKENVI